MNLELIIDLLKRLQVEADYDYSLHSEINFAIFTLENLSQKLKELCE